MSSCVVRSLGRWALLGAFAIGCASPAPTPRPGASAATRGQAQSDFSTSFGVDTPEAQGIHSAKLLGLTELIARGDLPILSLLISRRGKLVYELYTSSLGRDHAHYLMSVTKTVVSALVGIMIDEGKIGGPDDAITEHLPRGLFATDDDHRRFQIVILKDVLAMSALDAEVPPHSHTPEAKERLASFRASPNRLRFALTQRLLPSPGSSYQYTDITPMIAIGIIQYAAGKTALEIAEEHLFEPMGFRNYEWMHQDEAGLDNGGWGLRLRPIDMQKFGVLYLDHGRWEGRQLLSREWVDRSFSPWLRTRANLRDPNYGWYWWTSDFGTGWTARIAKGWKGQRIAVIPDQGLVVTMTGIFEDSREEEVFSKLMQDHVIPAVDGGGAALPPADPAVTARLSALLREVQSGELRAKPNVERRMIPSVGPKEGHHKFTP